MQVNAGKLQILTIAAMLVLVSGGIAAYAQNQSASAVGSPAAGVPVALAGSDTNSTSSSTNSTSTNSTSRVTSTTTVTSTTSANHTLCQPTTPIDVGRLVLPITAAGSSAGTISFSNSRGCLASITTVGGIFNVQIVLRYAAPVTQYNAVLVANGTSYALGNMVTGPGGNGQMQNQVLLKPGTYVVSIQIYASSSNTLVLQTGQGTIVSPPFPSATGGQGGQGNEQGNQGGQGPNHGNQGNQGQPRQHK